MPLSLKTESPEATQALGRSIAAYLRPNDVLLLCGDLGAGKTEFAQGVALGLGISEPVNSPTFNLLLVHRLPAAQAGRPHSLYHFDLYRLDEARQLEDLDYCAMLEDGAVSLVEWGDRFAEALPEDGLKVEITMLSGERRQFDFLALGEQGESLLAAWRESDGN